MNILTKSRVLNGETVTPWRGAVWSARVEREALDAVGDALRGERLWRRDAESDQRLCFALRTRDGRCCAFCTALDRRTQLVDLVCAELMPLKPLARNVKMKLFVPMKIENRSGKSEVIVSRKDTTINEGEKESEKNQHKS